MLVVHYILDLKNKITLLDISGRHCSIYLNHELAHPQQCHDGVKRL